MILSRLLLAELSAFLQVGGNKRAKEFLKGQSDYDHHAPLQQKYNTRAAALYRDKVNELPYEILLFFGVILMC